MKPNAGAGHARDSEKANQAGAGSRLDGADNDRYPRYKAHSASRTGPYSGHGPLQRKSQTAILGFGNRLWRDDGAGSVLAERLKQARPDAAIFDGGMVPENFLEKVACARPGSILLIDAGDFGGAPGEWHYFQGNELAAGGISTHAGSPRMLAAYLRARTGAEVRLLMIQPGQTGAGETLSPEVESTVELLAGQLLFPG